MTDELAQRRAAALARRARDAESLVASISDGEGAWRSYRVYAPKDLGIPAVELAHPDLQGRMTMLPHQAEALGHALITAARKAKE